MARPSKSQQFIIYGDAGIPTPDSGCQLYFGDDAADLKVAGSDSVVGGEASREEYENADDEARKTSGCTTTSISSLPESAWQTDGECGSDSPLKPQSPPIVRPSFRRPESVRRMQMSSPPPFGSRSPRHSAIRLSRAATSQSLRSAAVRGSPRPRRRISNETVELDQERKEYPLILLHITLLPVTPRWSAEAMQEILPESVLDGLRLLRSKVTDLVLQRGLLIPHPGEDYELLEERLLEALELKEERVTKCGHFRPTARESVSSISTTASSSDAAIGSSLDALSDDETLCETCRNCIFRTRSGTKAGGERWTVTVYAANGLMRASTWAVAWSDMERVDVEILPWISDDLVKRLDTKREEEEDEEIKRQGVEDERAFRKMEQETLARETLQRQEVEQRVVREPASLSAQGSGQSSQPSKKPSNTDDLPQVYRPSQIPLSVLMKNYIFLLSQDRRNVAMFFLAVIAIWIGLRTMAQPAILGLDTVANATYDTPFVEKMPALLSATSEMEYGTAVGGIETGKATGSAHTAVESEIILMADELDHGPKHHDNGTADIVTEPFNGSLKTTSIDDSIATSDSATLEELSISSRKHPGPLVAHDEAHYEMLDDAGQAHAYLYEQEDLGHSTDEDDMQMNDEIRA
ncbi:pathway-specific nitrogen regulator [Teratosphaeria destructans]|uniref:Pathway-specific nitrogen regulator n=1 Tax=Teratosphaeria destructans TaxID=418781 RepID=A0A9W7SRS6_9PEZI|nr:pathway-specific nitrogen regulator [Teratosphaeria destructans]